MGIEEKLSIGIRGSVNPKHDDPKGLVRGAVLTFRPEEGATVEFSWRGSFGRTGKIPLVGAFTGLGNVVMPNAECVFESTGYGDHYVRFRSKKLLSSNDEVKWKDFGVSEQMATLTGLMEYVKGTSTRLHFTNDEEFTVHCKNEVVVEGLSNTCEARYQLRVEVGYSNGANGRVAVEPNLNLRWTSHTPIDFQSAYKSVTALQAFFDFVSHEANDNHCVRLSMVDGPAVVVRTAQDIKSPVAHFRRMFEVPFSLIRSELGTMQASWIAEVHKSQAAQSVLRLLYYARLPVDLRFFIAFGAVESAHRDLLMKASKKGKMKAKQRLLSLSYFWEVMDVGDVSKYVDLLARHRDALAHSFASGDLVLTNWRDEGRGFQHLMIIAKAILLERMGLDRSSVLTYVTTAAGRVKDFLGTHDDGIVPDSDEF